MSITSPRRKALKMTEIFDGKDGRRRLSFRKAAYLSCTTKSTLHRAKVSVQERGSVLSSGRPSILTDEDERKIIDWITQKAVEKKCVTKKDIINYIYSILHERCTNTNNINDVSDSFVRKLLIKNNISLKKPITVYLFNAIPSKRCARTLFRNISFLRKERNYPNHLIFNMDESWSTPSVKSFQVVAVPDGFIPMTGQGTSHGHLTLIVCISADGSHVESSYVCEQQTYDPKELDKHNIHGLKTFFAPSGWINSEIFIGWINDIFLPHVNRMRDNNIDQYALLILDSHPTRNDSSVLSLLEENHIDLLVLPKGTTSQFQPLDLVVYGSYKNTLKKFFKTSGRYELLEASEDAVSESFTRSNIKQAWIRSRLLTEAEDEFVNRFEERPNERRTEYGEDEDNTTPYNNDNEEVIPLPPLFRNM
ncbi:hypothetical protein WA158_003376 [Blastocystis sp. Blastoise]